MISQLIYTSDAAEGLTDADLGCILATSQRNNAEMGLTGMLLYGRGRFIQVLEGPPDVLGRMMRGSTCSPFCSVARMSFPEIETGFSPG